jgi:predicted anti-sigma-YlaC factor YlaD
MKCDEPRIYLPAYLDGELDVAQTLRVREHLAECGECRDAQDDQIALAFCFARRHPVRPSAGPSPGPESAESFCPIAGGSLTWG